MEPEEWTTDSSEAVRLRQHAMSKCPISLMHTHLPVTLSDGQTYELESILRLQRQSEGLLLVSPLTRRLMEPWMVICHHVRNNDKEISTIIRSLSRQVGHSSA